MHRCQDDPENGWASGAHSTRGAAEDWARMLRARGYIAKVVKCSAWGIPEGWDVHYWTPGFEPSSAGRGAGMGARRSPEPGSEGAAYIEPIGHGWYRIRWWSKDEQRYYNLAKRPSREEAVQYALREGMKPVIMDTPPSLDGSSMDAAPVEQAWGHRAIRAAEGIRLKTLRDLTGIEDEAELASLREDVVRHAAEMAYRGLDPKGWREVWEDFWATYGAEIVDEERLEDLADRIDFERESHGPDEKEPESGLRVRAANGFVEVVQWDLTQPPDDPAYRKEWEERPVLRTSTEVKLKELLDPDARHRGSYGGDEGRAYAEVVVMPPDKQEEAVVAAAISWIYREGGTEEMVEQIGD